MSRGSEARDASDAPRIGIFGGTFDPPHRGHVSVAADVADALELDRVLWIPARRSPHKPERHPTSDAVRLEMVRLAAAGDPRFVVRDDELKRPAPSFTVHTLRALRAELGSRAELFLIMGVDQYRAFDRWLEPREILELATLAVMDRDGEGAGEALAPPWPEAAGRVVRVPVRRVDVSSTDVRRRVASGAKADDLVPAPVARVIERERLYGS